METTLQPTGKPVDIRNIGNSLQQGYKFGCTNRTVANNCRLHRPDLHRRDASSGPSSHNKGPTGLIPNNLRILIAQDRGHGSTTIYVWQHDKPRVARLENMVSRHHHTLTAEPLVMASAISLVVPERAVIAYLTNSAECQFGKIADLSERWRLVRWLLVLRDRQFGHHDFPSSGLQLALRPSGTVFLTSIDLPATGDGHILGVYRNASLSDTARSVKSHRRRPTAS